jgi:hypothetical protein
MIMEWMGKSKAQQYFAFHATHIDPTNLGHAKVTAIFG